MTVINKTTKFSAKRVAMLSVLCAMGLIMFMVESLFPPLFLPGAKMGLSNIFSLLTVILLGPVDALVLVLVRTTLGSMFTGNMSTLMYSMTAGVTSVIVSWLLVEFVYPKVSIIAISVVSAVVHNLTQNVVFCLVSNTPEMFSYMPWLALLGVVAGIIVGFAVWFILRTVPIRTFASVLGVSEEQFAVAVQPHANGKTGCSVQEANEPLAEKNDATQQSVGEAHADGEKGDAETSDAAKGDNE